MTNKPGRSGRSLRSFPDGAPTDGVGCDAGPVRFVSAGGTLSRRVSELPAAARRCDVRLVAGIVRERPPRRREVVADDVAASGESCGDAGLGLLDRHPNGEMDRAAATGSR